MLDNRNGSLIQYDGENHNIAGNTIDELTNTEKRILERVIQTIDSLGIDGSDTIIEAIINEFATK